MRQFHDEQGHSWEVAVTGASYGCMVLIFSRMQGAEIRQLLMGSVNQVDAESELLAMDEAELRALLAKAPPWDPSLRSIPWA